MVSIELKNNNAYQWNNIGDVHSIGYIFYNNKLYKDIELAKLIANLNENEIESFVEKLDGCFALVINFQNKVLIISDLLRTFPVFYNISKDNILIKDNIMKYENREFDNDNVRELSYCNYVTGNTTIFKNIYQLEGHQIVEIDKNNYTVKKKKYFEYEYNFEIKDDNIDLTIINKKTESKVFLNIPIPNTLSNKKYIIEIISLLLIILGVFIYVIKKKNNNSHFN